MVRQVAGELAGRAVVVQINSQENPLLAGRFAVRGIPALLLLKGGRVLGTLSGVQQKQAVLAWFRDNAR